jgi:hypothetical protein
MKSIQLELPDKLAEGLDTIVQQGWSRSEEEVLRFALLEFLRRHSFELFGAFPSLPFGHATLVVRLCPAPMAMDD